MANDHQLPPIEDFTTWLILGGRGAGKTRAGAEWIRASVATSDAANDDNPFAHKARAIALVAETYADAREVMIEGPSGIRAVTPNHLRPVFEASRRRLVWENGAVAYAFSAEDPDGIRGYQFDTAWSDANIDFIGIDNYMPLADWRDGFAHLDALAGAQSQYDLTYLMGNIRGGEGFDWFYASDADRAGQVRTAISDGAYAEPWIYRYKDLWNWWSNPHHNRPGGVRDASPTSWVPRSKPFIFTEIGAPAVDKAANQPNVFVDAKSSESALPHFSNGRRDDLAQRRLLEAHAIFWGDGANNPVSPLYGGPMVDAARSYVYCWDARPFPAFPARNDLWGDAQNWEKGHWLNGRLGRAPLGLLVSALAHETGFAAMETDRLDGTITGYVIDRPMSAREMIDPLADVYQFDMIESGGAIRCQPRHGAPVITIEAHELSARDNGAFSLSLAQEADLPAAVRLGFIDEGDGFAPAVAEARDPGAVPAREIGTELPAVMGPQEAEARARSLLADAWVMREQLELSLPPSLAAIEPGDAIIVSDIGLSKYYRITEIEDRTDRRAELVRVSPSVYDAPVGPAIFGGADDIPVYASPSWELFELPPLRDSDDAAQLYFASFSDPWPGAVSLYRNPSVDSAPVLAGAASARAIMGRLTSDLGPGASGRWHNQTVRIGLSFGTLSSRLAEEVLNGANAAAVQSINGRWEVFQFREATLEADGGWTLSGLLRGQAGSEREALAGADAGARFVLLSPSLARVDFNSALRGLSFNWQAGPETDIPGTQTFTQKPLMFEARGLKPFSPVHVRVHVEGGDVRLTWIRRTRIGGDSWEGEVPLAEQSERYRVTIFDDQGEALRNADVMSPDYLYEAADIASDFGPGGIPVGASVSVVQISDAVGEGEAAGVAMIN